MVRTGHTASTTSAVSGVANTAGSPAHTDANDVPDSVSNAP